MRLFSRLFPLRIREKLFIVISILIALISIFIYAFFPARHAEVATQAIATKARSIIEMTAFSISPALYFDDFEAMEEVFQSTKQNKDVVYIVVLDNSGKVVASFNKEELDRVNFIEAKDNTHISSDGMVLGIMTPILYRSQEIGQLYLGFSLEELKEEIAKIRRTIALISFLIFIIGMIAIFGISTVITSPLRHMTETVMHISKGDLTYRASVSAQDEVGQLARSINMMVDNLEKAQNELKELNINLEKLVEERTTELKAANIGLQKEIVERKKTEEKIKKIMEELERSNAELEEFAYIVSHDLKAPLRAVSQLATWISEDYADSFDEDGNEKINLLISRVGRMDNLIDGILQYSRAGRMKGKEEEVNLYSIVKEIIEDLSPPKNIQIVIEKQLPVVLADKVRIEQVFQNLISNAVKFMDKPEGEIKIGSVDEMTHWKISIADNGPGISEKYQDKIFQIFQTLESRDKHENTGIGLTVVKKIVELYGGKIWVESKVGQGSTFFFTLPKKRKKD